MSAQELKKIRKLLSRIAKIAAEFTDAEEFEEQDDEPDNLEIQEETVAICTPKWIPARLTERAAKNAVELNVFNQPEISMMAQAGGDEPTAAFLALVTTKYWGSNQRTLGVKFLDTNAADLKRRILGHLNAWNCGVSFKETGGTGDIRISRGPGGYWSFLGTDNRLIQSHRPTMNLQGFTMNTSEKEFRRVVQHEAGHALGFPHEHMRRALVNRIDRAKAYAFFGGPPNNWSRAMVDMQVLTPLEERTLIGTPADQTSIMCYQFPGTITRDGRPILGGPGINKTDAAFAQIMYPRATSPAAHNECSDDASIDDLDESDDWFIE